MWFVVLAIKEEGASFGSNVGLFGRDTVSRRGSG